MNQPWLDRALKYLGEHEIAGKTDNQFILDCFSHTSYQASHDEVPWCAAFVCRVLEETNYPSMHNAAAVSYLRFGREVLLQPGAIVVFQWVGGSHHVSICHHIVNSNYVACIGGNQADAVKISVFNRKFIQATRWPGVPPP